MAGSPTPLEQFACLGTPVTDLSPLRGMRLRDLMLHATSVFDLSPLRGMPLTSLHIRGTLVTDLSPLKDLPLKKLFGDFQRDRDFAILREIKTLEVINDQSAAEFLR